MPQSGGEIEKEFVPRQRPCLEIVSALYPSDIPMAQPIGSYCDLDLGCILYLGHLGFNWSLVFGAWSFLRSGRY